MDKTEPGPFLRFVGMYSARYTDRHTDSSESAASRSEQVYRELYEELLQGLHPFGVPLREGRVAQRFEVSRTPARDALRRLEAEGHLVRNPEGALTPNPPRITGMRDMYELRLLLELSRVRLTSITESARTGAVGELRADWESLLIDPVYDEEFADASFVWVDEDFHVRLAAAAGNSAIVRALRDVNDRLRLLRVHDFKQPGRVHATIREHLAVLDAVQAGDPERSADLLEAHINLSASVVEDRVGEVIQRSFDPQDTP